jgi:hypothetical protein
VLVAREGRQNPEEISHGQQRRLDVSLDFRLLGDEGSYEFGAFVVDEELPRTYFEGVH